MSLIPRGGEFFWDPFSEEEMGMPMVPYMSRFPVTSELMQYSPQRALGPLLKAQRQEMAAYTPILKADLIETEDGFNVHCDLPGCDRDDLDINVEDGMLRIKAERKHSYAEDTGASRKIERSFGRMERVIKLPKTAKIEESKVTFQNGVLSIHFPKEEGGGKRTKLCIT
jgi:HSP20 family molecular chaperone IbpA